MSHKVILSFHSFQLSVSKKKNNMLFKKSNSGLKKILKVSYNLLLSEIQFLQ